MAPLRARGMSPHHSTKKLYPKISPAIYITGIQYFIIQLVVASRWHPPYSVSRDTISDLGNTTCGIFNSRFVCSPRHDAMNTSLMALGAAMVLGSMLLRTAARRRAARTGLVLIAVAGAAVILAGFFPENTVTQLHGAGTAVAFTASDAGIILTGWVLSPNWTLRLYSVITGALVAGALGLYASSNYLGLGEGGIERLVAYPQTAWLIVIGLSLLVRGLDFPISEASPLPAGQN